MGPIGDVFFSLDLFDFSSFLSLSFSTIIGGKTYNKLYLFSSKKKELYTVFFFTAAKGLQLQNQTGERKSGESTNIIFLSEKAVAGKFL